MDKKIIDYMAVSRRGMDCLQQLVDGVCAKIKEGWQPVGGICVLDTTTVMQAMVKYSS